MRLACPTCRQPLNAPDAPGRKVACPSCGQKILLPSPPPPPKPAAANRTLLAAPAALQPPRLIPAGAIVPAGASPPPALPRSLAPYLLGGGAVAALLLLVVVVLLATRTPHYTVAELATGYTPALKGRIVRVSGPVLDTEPAQDGRGYFIRLYTPGHRLQVAILDAETPARPIRRDEVVTLVGEVETRLSLRPGRRLHNGAVSTEEAEVVLLRNARVEP